MALSVATAIGAVLPGCGPGAGLTRRVRRARPAALAYFSDGELEQIEAIGREILAQTPDEEAALLALFEPALIVIEQTSGAADVLSAAIRGELSELRTYEVQGWIFAPIEAGLAAMLVYPSG